MNVVARCGRGALVLLLLTVPGRARGQSPEPANRNWDLEVWVAGATGEENRDSFAEAQIFSAGVSVGKVLTDEIGDGWRRGHLEYVFNLMPVFVHLTPQLLYGGGLEPVILRWNSGLRAGRVAPYLELAGGGLWTNGNLPAGETSAFNFTARGGGGIEIFAANKRSVDVGFRWWHISNANLGAKNPEFNGFQVSLGYHWFK